MSQDVLVVGGGMAALNALYATAERLGVRVLYEHPVNERHLDDLPAGAVIVCGGGHQADLRHGFVNRGTPFATGEVLRSLLAEDVSAMGRADAGHLVAVDARSPDHDGGIVTRVDGMHHGMVVDAAGKRFQDETAITGQTRYAVWGRLVAKRPERRATLVLDADGILAAQPSVFPPLQAASLPQMAALLEVDAGNLEQSAQECGRGCRPPFFAFPIRPGITFTCLGVKMDETARLVMADGHTCPNVFAAGMIMAPNVLGTGYLAGAGMSIGAVFGRIAGAEAARMSLAEARRTLTLCTVCNYCNGFCEMFRAAERRQRFSDGDLAYLAHLCHDCRPVCQYAPPHPFAINVPKTLAELRRQSWGGRPWLALALVVLIPVLTPALVPWEVLFARHVGSGAFYAVLPWSVVCTVAAVPLLWSIVALGLNIRRFWRDSGGGKPSWRSVRAARRWFHHALVFGLLLCFAATTGLALLVWRDTTAMGMLLAVHLGCVAAFFATLGHGKFAHAPYRAAALLRAAMERQNDP